MGNNPVNYVDPLGLEAGYIYNPDGSMTLPNESNYAQGAKNYWNLVSWLSNQFGEIVSHPGNGIVGSGLQGPLMGAMENAAGDLAPSLKGSLNAATQKAAICGTKLHADRPGGLPDQLRNKYPETEFKFTPPGKQGQDVQVVGGMHPSAYGYGNWPEGVNFGDFKPNTTGGLRTFNSDSQSKWNAPTTMLQYDPSTGRLVAR